LTNQSGDFYPAPPTADDKAVFFDPKLSGNYRGRWAYLFRTLGGAAPLAGQKGLLQVDGTSFEATLAYFGPSSLFIVEAALPDALTQNEPQADSAKQDSAKPDSADSVPSPKEDADAGPKKTAPPSATKPFVELMAKAQRLHEMTQRVVIPQEVLDRHKERPPEPPARPKKPIFKTFRFLPEQTTEPNDGAAVGALPDAQGRILSASGELSAPTPTPAAATAPAPAAKKRKTSRKASSETPGADLFLDRRRGWIMAMTEALPGGDAPWRTELWPAFDPKAAPPLGVSFIWVLPPQLPELVRLLAKTASAAGQVLVCSGSNPVLEAVAELASESRIVFLSPKPTTSAALDATTMETHLEKRREERRLAAELAQAELQTHRRAEQRAAEKLEHYLRLQALETSLGHLKREAAQRKGDWSAREDELQAAHKDFEDLDKKKSGLLGFLGSEKKKLDLLQARKRLDEAERAMRRVRLEMESLLSEARTVEADLADARDMVKGLPAQETLAAELAALKSQGQLLNSKAAALELPIPSAQAESAVLSSADIIMARPGGPPPPGLFENIILAAPVVVDRASRERLAAFCAQAKSRLIVAADFSGWSWTAPPPRDKEGRQGWRNFMAARLSPVPLFGPAAGLGPLPALAASGGGSSLRLGSLVGSPNQAKTTEAKRPSAFETRLLTDVNKLIGPVSVSAFSSETTKAPDSEVDANQASSSAANGLAEREEKAEQAEQAEQTERAEQTEQTKRSEQAVQAEQTEQAKQAERIEQTEQTIRTEQAKQTKNNEIEPEKEKTGEADRGVRPKADEPKDRPEKERLVAQGLQKASRSLSLPEIVGAAGGQWLTPNPARFSWLSQLGFQTGLAKLNLNYPAGPSIKAFGDGGPSSPGSALASVRLAVEASRLSQSAGEGQPIYVISASKTQAAVTRALLADLGFPPGVMAGEIHDFENWPQAPLVILDSALAPPQIAHPWSSPETGRPALIRALALAAGALAVCASPQSMDMLPAGSVLAEFWANLTESAWPGWTPLQSPPFWESLNKASKEALVVLPAFEPAWWPALAPYFVSALRRKVKVTIISDYPTEEAKEYSGQVIRELRLFGGVVILAEGFNDLLALIDGRFFSLGAPGGPPGQKRWPFLISLDLPETAPLLADLLQSRTLQEKLGPGGRLNCPLCGWPYLLVNQGRPRDLSYRQSLRLACLNPACLVGKRPRRLDERWPFSTPPLCPQDKQSVYQLMKSGRRQSWICPVHGSACPVYRPVPGDCPGSSPGR
jgi:hypothetical protein